MPIFLSGKTERSSGSYTECLNSYCLVCVKLCDINVELALFSGSTPGVEPENVAMQNHPQICSYILK